MSSVYRDVSLEGLDRHQSHRQDKNQQFFMKFIFTQARKWSVWWQTWSHYNEAGGSEKFPHRLQPLRKLIFDRIFSQIFFA